MVPEGWSKKDIGQILTIGSGKDYKHLAHGEIPVYGTGGYMLSVDQYLHEGESVCIGRKGTIDKPTFLKGKFWTVDTLFFTKDFRDCTPSYVFALFQRINWRKYNEASGVPSLSKSTIESIPVLLPPLKEQQKIAEILSTWDKSIEATEKLLENSKTRKKALMQQLLTGKKRLPGFGPTKNFMITKYGEVPSDWEFSKISDFSSQKSLRANDGVTRAVLSCSKHEGFVDSLSYFKKQVFSEDTSNYKVIKRNWFGFPANHIEEGSIGLQNVCDEGIVSPIYIVFALDEKRCIPEYLYPVLKTEHYRQIFAASTNASVDRRGSLRWDGFGIIKVALPPVEEQRAISAVISTAENQISALEQNLTALKNEKKALMQQLLTGKKRVKVEETE